MKKRERVTGKEQYYTSNETVETFLDFLLDRFNIGEELLNRLLECEDFVKDDCPVTMVGLDL